MAKVRYKKVGATELTQNTSMALRTVRSGVDLLVTLHGTPVAAIVSPFEFRMLRNFAKIRPDLLSKLFKDAKHEERLALATLISWLEDLESES